MGANFYGYRRSTDLVTVTEEKVHLGLSSMGWQFLFQADRDRGITGIQSWLRQLDGFFLITDEYGAPYSADEFLEYVEARRDKKSHFPLTSVQRRYWTGAEWPFDDEGCTFAYYDFS
jgi:hypothetical protein